MNNLLIIIVISLSMLFSSCYTFTLSNGKKYRQMFPVKDKYSLKRLDTSKYWLDTAQISKYTLAKDRPKNKAIITLFYGSMARRVARETYVYFWNPSCPATASDIKKLDSLAKDCVDVFVLSLRNDYKLIESKLNLTGFKNFPIHIVGNQDSKILLQRKVDFIRDACKECYKEYKDDLIFADYLVITPSKIHVWFPNSTNSILH